MTEAGPTVYVVDDDEAVRDSLALLLHSVGLYASVFESARDFLEQLDPDRPGCLVLDVRMPGMSGMELVQRLHERNCALPIIVITGHGDVPMAVEAMKLGAMDFLQKPFRDQELLDRIQQALARSETELTVARDRDCIRQRLDELTPREQQVLEQLLDGKPNKVIASDLALSQRTVEIHRARIMDKMQARSLASLVRMVVRVRE